MTSIEKIVDDIIASGITARASDIHIDPGLEMLVISFRIDGIVRINRQLSLELHESIMIRIKVLARLPLDDKRLPKDGRFSWASADGALNAEIRVSMMPTTFGENAVLRIFDPLVSILSFKELGFSLPQISSLDHALSARSGIIILAGPTGSGKTTTLYSMLEHIRKDGRRILTVEDPVERYIDGVRQIEVGSSTLLEYTSVLRSLLRQDPDVIMLGEIRDSESATLAFQAAMTGHLIITTVHAFSVAGIYRRLEDMGISQELMDSNIRFCISQRLLGKVCIHCKEEVKVDRDTLFRLSLYEDISSSIFYRGKGCDECGKTGVLGRTVVCEMSDDASPLHANGYRKASEGIVSFEDAHALVNEAAHVH